MTATAKYTDKQVEQIARSAVIVGSIEDLQAREDLINYMKGFVDGTRYNRNLKCDDGQKAKGK